jgi:hypothetical protein
MPIPTEILLINCEYFKKLTQINGAVEDTFILPCITLAQDKYVQAYTGQSLMEKMKADLNSWDEPYLTFYNNHLVKVVAWWTMVELVPKLTYKYNNGTLGQYAAEGFTAIGDSEMKDEILRVKSNAEYYTQKMIEYLCDNSSDFPEYTTCVQGKRPPRKSPYTGTSFLFSDNYPTRKFGHGLY